MSCMTSPAIAIAAPVSMRATVRGTRVIQNISKPSVRDRSYTPVKSDSTAKPRTMITVNTNDFVHNLEKEG